MTKEIQPMLGAAIPSDTQEELEAALNKLTYPLIGSPKIDGIRCFIHPFVGPVSRTLKPWPNEYINQTLALIKGFDGEITAGPPDKITAPTVFSDAYSFCMTQNSFESSPKEFTLSVFDFIGKEAAFKAEPYSNRLKRLKDFIASFDLLFPSQGLYWHVRYHDTADLRTVDEVLAYEEVCLKNGYEGIILRSPQGTYKFGRSTLKQQGLLKLKRMEDGIGEITDIEPTYKNENELTRDERGYAKRSSKNAGMLELPRVGAFWVGDFKVGAGRSTHEERAQWWDIRDTLIGRKIKYKWQKVGSKDAPRFGVFVGWLT